MTLALKLADARYEGFDEGFAEGREAGLQQGLERGAYENKLETARNLLSEGLAPQMVAHCTNLPLELVQSLMESSST